MDLPDNQTPLVVAPESGSSTNFKLFCYQEKDARLHLVEHKLHQQVPDNLKQYLVPYHLAPPQNSSSTNSIEATAKHYSTLPQHLKNLAVIDSKTSGTHKSSDIYFSILLPLLKAFGLAHVYVSTATERTIHDHAKSFSSSSTVIFLAGDTSIHEFVNSLAETRDKLRLTVAAVPTGTGNALSTSIGHKSIAHAISRIFTGTVVELPSFRVKFPEGSRILTPPSLASSPPTVTPIDSSLRALAVVSWGFHAALVADSDTPELRKLGVERFKKAAEQNLARTQAYHGRIKLKEDGKAVELNGPHSYVLFTTVSSLESTFVISPHSHAPTTDLHLVQFDQLPSDEIMEIMMKAYDSGAHVKDKRVNYKKLSFPSSSATSSELVATIQVQETDDMQKRWCVDGRTVVLGHDNMVKIYKPTSHHNGWSIYIVQ